MATGALTPGSSGKSGETSIASRAWRQSVAALFERWTSPLHALFGTVYPPHCLACDADLEELASSICAACISKLVRNEPACRRCGLDVGPYVDTADGCLGCRKESFRFDGVIRSGHYADELRAMLLSFKSVHNELLGPVLARLMFVHRGALLREVRADSVVAVPLHYVRYWRRGFNQAESVARRLALQLNLPHHSRILKRVRRTKPQSELKREQRRNNMRDAFCCRGVPHVKRATILLVDDILTTGATCSEAAGALKAAGAARVVVAVVARSQEHSGG